MAPRTLDLAAHTTRRDAFIDAAQRLMATKGFEALSIQDVLDETGASKGAFYHYFDSKQNLLDGIVERLVREAVAGVQPLLGDPSRSAIEKLKGLFGGMASYKSARTEMFIALIEAWMSDENALVRERLRVAVIEEFTLLLTSIVRQGVTEGSFSVASPEHTARVMVGLILAASEHGTALYLARERGEVSFEEVLAALDAYPVAFERLLAAPPGSLRWFDADLLRQWFG